MKIFFPDNKLISKTFLSNDPITCKCRVKLYSGEKKNGKMKMRKKQQSRQGNEETMKKDNFKRFSKY